MDFTSRVIYSILIITFFLISAVDAQTAINKGIFYSQKNAKSPLNAPSFTDKFITPDKAQHFMGSLISTVLFYKICQEPLGIENTNSKIFAVGITMSLGISKEIYDHSRTSSIFSWKDLLADLAGVAVGLILINQS